MSLFLTPPLTNNYELKINNDVSMWFSLTTIFSKSSMFVKNRFMSTVVINIDDNSSVKLFLELAKKLHFKAHVLTEAQREEIGLVTLMKQRSKEPSLPVESAYKILKKVK